MNTLFSNKFFYHIYPLGLCGCPKKNDFSCPAGNAFEKLTPELIRIKNLKRAKALFYFFIHFFIIYFIFLNER